MVITRLMLFLLFCITLCTNLSSQSRFKKTRLQKDSLDFKIGQMLCGGFRGMHIDSVKEVVRDITEFSLGGVILFDYDVEKKVSYRNIASPLQVETLLQALDSVSERNHLPQLLKAIDQEGGRVNRLKMKYGFPFFPSAAYLGALSDADTTKYYAALTAETLKALGFNLNFAPVLDLNRNPENPVIGKIERSFSSNPDTVVKNALIIIRESSNQGIHSVVKHFPGHGSSQSDSHLGVTDVSNTWDEIEIKPFASILKSAQDVSVMTAHLFNREWDSRYPATLSKSVVTDILRKKLIFNGVIFSDDLQMKAVTKQFGFEKTIYLALEAGVDILVFGNNIIYDPDLIPKAHRVIKNFVRSGKISRKRIDDSYQRILALKNTIRQ